LIIGLNKNYMQRYFTTPAKMEEDIQAALLHASDCDLHAGECVEQHCSGIKRKLMHYNEAAVDHICSECLDVIDMCMRHALECGRGHTCTYVSGPFLALHSSVYTCNSFCKCPAAVLVMWFASHRSGSEF
jgi:hypothetical protein